MGDLHIRPATAADIGYIIVTWKRSALTKAKEPSARFARVGIDHLIGVSDINILCLADSPARILGWIARYNDEVQWVFVEDTYRGNGFARYLRSKK